MSICICIKNNNIVFLCVEFKNRKIKCLILAEKPLAFNEIIMRTTNETSVPKSLEKS